MDIKAMVETVQGWPLGQLALLFGVLAAIYWGAKSLGADEGAGKRRRRLEAMFGHWQLMLLASTAFVLSCASGWTTWDGMKNFTGEPVLSAMVTFGIQGVMLIVAWIIGETFATGMNQQAPARGGGRKSFIEQHLGQAQIVIGFVAGTLFFVALFVAFMHWFGSVNLTAADTYKNGWSALANQLLFAAVVMLFAATLLLNSRSDVVAPYVQSLRVMAKSAVLWVMFLACMATSVFFSFDSLFSTIFPQSERVRASELRAQNQVAGIVSEVGTMITTRQLTETERLFETEGWKAYEEHLGRLAREAKEAEGTVQRYFEEQMEARRRGIAQQQERIASSNSGQAGLSSKKNTLTDELSRLKGERPALAADYAEKKNALDARAKEVDAKRVEAMAEDRGVEGTGKVGKGPIYRERVAEMAKLQDYIKIGEERVKDSQKRLNVTETRIAQIERELAAVDGDLAKLKGEAQTAESRIRLAEDAKTQEEGAKITDPSLMLPRFERVRGEFRQTPTEARLADLQGLCVQMLGAMTSAPTTKPRVAGIDCDPKTAAEASARVFALNAGSEAFGRNCVGGDKLGALKTADELFGFSRRCVQDSGLAAKDTDALRYKINTTELARDDKANRFVVTLNAFGDGNKLAYLALAIAVAIDSLVFMSGLFGANALKSPLSDVPTTRARSASQLEGTINAALGARPFENASLALDHMRPITNDEGFSSQVELTQVPEQMAKLIRRVLTAGADIGAVEAVGVQGREIYRVRGELREYLSSVCDRHLKSDASFVTRAKLENIVRVALMPHPKEHAELVIHYMEPVSELEGYTSEVVLHKDLDAYDTRIVRKVLNAASTQGAVSADKKAKDRYYITPALYETLAHIYAGDPPSKLYAEARNAVALGGPTHRTSIAHGGNLTPDTPQLEQAHTPAPRQIAPQVPQAPPPIPRDPFDTNQLRARFWGEFLAALGLTYEQTYERLRGQGVREAALGAWQALSRHGERNQALGKLLDRQSNELNHQLDQTYSSLKAATSADQRRIDILEGVDNEVRTELPILMLFPEIGLVPHLIEQLERAAQPDDGLKSGEQGLKDTLVDVNAVLNSANLGSADSWNRISALLDRGERSDGNDAFLMLKNLQNRRNTN